MFDFFYLPLSQSTLFSFDVKEDYQFVSSASSRVKNKGIKMNVHFDLKLIVV